MNWTRLAINTILFGVSCIIAILLVEVIYKLSPLQEKEKVYRWDLRYMLFSNDDGESIFRNIENFFVYQSNANIHSTAYYFVNGQWTKEYEYVIPTNNFGLVQTNNIQANTQSVLLLGDSYTEGQGTAPWFELFRKNNPLKNLQPVNGGLLGTGFKQWWLLHNHLLTQGIDVKKLVVIFISDDYVRNVWNFPRRTQDCLADYSQCMGNENFFGAPKDNGVLDAFLEKLRNYRETHLYKKEGVFKENPQSLFPGTRRAIRFIKETLKNPQTADTPNTLANREAIRQFIKIYKNDVLFVHIPQKDEILDHAVSPLGKTTRKEIESFGGEFYDGQALCGLTKEDYFVNDGHPNKNGYSKIATCVTAAVNKKWPHQ